MSESDFQFRFPVEKGGARVEGGRRFVYGVASTEKLDLDKEVVGAECISKSLDYFLKNGRIDWDHKSKTEPRFIIGKPVKGTFDAQKRFHVKAELYKGMEIADQVWEQLQAGNDRIGWSIGGKVLKKSLQFDKSQGEWRPRIVEALINHIALTPHAKNTDTYATTKPYADFIKSLATIDTPTLGQIVVIAGQEYLLAKRDEIEKAISSGGGTALGTNPIIPQSLEQDIKVFKSYVTSSDFSRDPDAILAHFSKNGTDKDLAKAIASYLSRNGKRVAAIRGKGE